MLVRVTLPRDRHQLGMLEVLSDDTVLFACACYGKSDNAYAAQNGNPERDPLRIGGDLPMGTYSGRVNGVLLSLHTYGPHPVVRLDPTGGDAAIAERNGRRGLLAHGGALNAQGKLRPTHGCLRLADGDQEQLVRTLGDEPCQWLVQERAPTVAPVAA
jgi:hypothetical protein